VEAPFLPIELICFLARGCHLLGDDVRRQTAASPVIADVD
jgi:hypothetical protein